MDIAQPFPIPVLLFTLQTIAAAGAFFFGIWIPGVTLSGEARPGAASAIRIAGIGLTAWIVQAVVFGWLGMRFLTYPYIAACFVFAWRRGWRFGLVGFNPSRYGLLLIGIAVAGILNQTYQLVWSAFVFPQGLYLTVDDTLWHLSLTNELVNRFPPFEPGMYGVLLRNYHYLANLVTAEAVRVFGLPLVPMQFLYTPVLYSAFFGASMYFAARELGLSRGARAFTVFLAYFSSDIIYLLTVVTRGVAEFTVLPLEDGTMFMENPPRALSYILFLFGLGMFLRWRKSGNRYDGIASSVALGLVIGCKVHTGIMVLSGLAGFAAWRIIRRDLWSLWVPAAALAVSLGIYLPSNAGAGLPVWVPFEMARMFSVQPLLNLMELELRRQTYLAHGNTIRIFQMHGMMLALFLTSQFGIRMIGLSGIVPLLRRQTDTGILLVSGLVSSWVFGTLVIQPMAYADIFNAYLAGGIALTLFAAVAFERIWTRMPKYGKAIVLVLVLISTLPRPVSRILRYADIVRKTGPAIPRRELEAMRAVHGLTSPRDILLVSGESYDSVQPYVTVFTGRPVFLSGKGVLTSHGIRYGARENTVAALTAETGSGESLRGTGITHIYVQGKVPVSVRAPAFRRLYDENGYSLYRYERP